MITFVPTRPWNSTSAGTTTWDWTFDTTDQKGGARRECAGTTTESEFIYSAHYTQCRKPWACIAVSFPGGKKPNSTHKYDFAIDINDCILDHCMMLLEKWHFVRRDLETKLWNLTGDDSILQEGRNGTYRSDVFLGHCTEDGKDGYIKLSGKEESYTWFHELYG